MAGKKPRNTKSTLEPMASVVAGIGYLGGAAAEFARPADANAYAAKDVVSNSTSAPTILTFTNVVRSIGMGGYITKAKLITDLKTCVARFRLHLFNVAPAAINDNSPMLSLYANRAGYLGWVDLPAAQTEDPTNSTGASAFVTSNDSGSHLPLGFIAAASDYNLYGLLETLDAFTPASAQNFHVGLLVDGY